jgi:hypothetical protein
MARARMKAKPIELGNSAGKRLVLIGWPRGKNDGRPYINLNDAAGNCVGMLEDRDLRRLRVWIDRCLNRKDD